MTVLRTKFIVASLCSKLSYNYISKTQKRNGDSLESKSGKLLKTGDTTMLASACKHNGRREQLEQTIRDEEVE